MGTPRRPTYRDEMTISTGTPIPTGLPTTAAPTVPAQPPAATLPAPEPAPPSTVPATPPSPSRSAGDLSSADTGPLSLRLRAALPSARPGLTAPGGALLGVLVLGAAAALDLALGDTLGLGFRVTFILCCVLLAGALRVRSLLAAVVLPPLLYAGAAAVQTWSGGQAAGRREMALDVATTLALSAPTLFVGTALAAAVALTRVVVHLVRR
ncbi:MAG: hypothetical protein QOI54_264 [Actinomycetota bacterium]|jgi:hypothetical protein|nr:hypothetical protein [Actinomycetota bacterium]